MTFFLLVLLLHCSSAVAGESSSLRGGNSADDSRNLIIGGAPAVPGDYPYFVHYESIGCGGTLIAPDIVLTAGHCKVDKLADYKTVYVGRHNPLNDDAQGFTVVDQSRHGEYNDQVCCGYHNQDWYYGVFNDFHLLKLSGESSTPVIRLNSNAVRPQSGQKLHVIGFGDIDPGDPFRAPSRLHDVTVNYLTNQECAAKSIYPATLLDDSSMCATDYREDACSGDSGGPLIKKGQTDIYDVQVGVVSWGYGCASQPGVYARVSDGYDWIRTEVCRLSRNPPASFQCPSPELTTPEDVTSDANTPEDVTSDANTPENNNEGSEINRSPLPSGRSCSVASGSPMLCCLSLANQGTDGGEECVPTMDGGNFDGGTSCEPKDWVNTNDPDSFDAGFCEVLLSGRELLPEGQRCSSITDKKECCKYRDNRSDGTSFDKQPCLASREEGGFPQGQGVCEPANFVVKFAPESALDCADVVADDQDEPTSDIFPHDGEGVFETEEDGLQRTDLPEGRWCSLISNAHVCCAARDSRYRTAKSSHHQGDDCIPAKNGDTFSSGSSCEATGWVEENDMLSNSDGYCEKLSDERQTLQRGITCSSLVSTRSCCFYKDSDGHACLPSKRMSGYNTGNRCEPSIWVVKNAPNSVLDCARF